MALNPADFSFNVKGGRCESCQGEGQVKIEMQFMPDVYITCDVCHGARYNAQTLDVKLKNKSIADPTKKRIGSNELCQALVAILVPAIIMTKRIPKNPKTSTQSDKSLIHNLLERVRKVELALNEKT